MEEVASSPLEVRLVAYTKKPYDLAIAAAHSCRSEQPVAVEKVTEKQRLTLGPSTWRAGHHTLYEHSQFTFRLYGISRLLTWSFLHSHPFYNSSQQSQRFVKLEKIRVYKPCLEGSACEIYESAIRRAWTAYRELSELLRKDDDLLDWLRGLKLPKGRSLETEASQRALETARYVVPLAAQTGMHHTIDGLTLHRYKRLAELCDVPTEAKAVVAAMINEVKAVDPDFFDKIGEDCLALEQSPDYAFFNALKSADPKWGTAAFNAEFDAELGGRSAKLISQTNVDDLADSVRTVFGLPAAGLAAEEIVRLLLSPETNSLLCDTLNSLMQSPLGKAMNSGSYKVKKKISNCCDSQNQRHRMVPATRQLFLFSDTAEPDYIMPKSIAANRAARTLFEDAMEAAWDAKERLLKLGVEPEHALYVLPNAKAVRLVESGSLLNFYHKWRLRSCWNAQLEIYETTLDELEQLVELCPTVASQIGPYCWLRKRGGRLPYCPEGMRFCGFPVWNSWSDATFRRTRRA